MCCQDCRNACRSGKQASAVLAVISVVQAFGWLFSHDQGVFLEVLPDCGLTISQESVIQKAAVCMWTHFLCCKHTVAQIHTAWQHIIPAAEVYKWCTLQTEIALWQLLCSRLHPAQVFSVAALYNAQRSCAMTSMPVSDAKVCKMTWPVQGVYSKACSNTAINQLEHLVQH